MRLDAMLDRCLLLERRAAGLYRRFAEASGRHQDLREVWRRLASEEDEHAASLAIARATVDPAVGAESRVEGWDELIAAAERVLEQGERVPSPSLDDQLVLALDLERTEIDVLRQVLLDLAGHVSDTGVATSRHALELAEVASKHSADARVRMREALIRAHEQLGVRSLDRA
jgi:rubrerythrin